MSATHSKPLACGLQLLNEVEQLCRRKPLDAALCVGKLDAIPDQPWSSVVERDHFGRRLVGAIWQVSRALEHRSGGKAASIEESLLGAIAKTHGTEQVNETLPTLFIAGFGKGGTTSLHALLARHPDVVPALAKEVSYFNRMSAFSERLYTALYPPGEPIHRLDSTPAYVTLPDAKLDHIHRTVGRAHFILTTRHPVDRAVSAYFSPGRQGLREAAAKGKGAELPTVEASLERECGMIEHRLPNLFAGELSRDAFAMALPTTHVYFALYEMHIQRFRERLPDARIDVIRAEDTIFAPDAEVCLREALPGVPLLEPEAHRTPVALNASAKLKDRVISSSLRRRIEKLAHEVRERYA